ncbi:MAG: MMPL family transporter [Rickettsiales bacterium]|nr:MMPL family transporter [Rickettsiales bacterium]
MKNHNFFSLISDKAKYVIFFFIIIVILASIGLKDFYLDASSDSLSLENDLDVSYYQKSKEKYGSDNFLIITYKPETKIFSKLNLSNLELLEQKLSKIKNVKKVTTILNLPLFNSPKIDITEIGEKNINLLHPNVDLSTAPNEILNNPLYKNNLISSDGKTTAILVELIENNEFQQLNNRKKQLLKQITKNNIEKSELAEISLKIKKINRQTRKEQDNIIKEIREILANHKDNNQIYLGGLPMIVSDSIEYIKSDIKIFGLAIIMVICSISFLLFKNLRFVIIPLFCAAIVIISLSGYLGYSNWPITTVSANFIALLLILTMSITIHLIVRYEEELQINNNLTQKKLIIASCQKMALPCFYTTITSMVAFASLTISSLKPVIDFGWMMFIGLIIAYICSFTLFPALNSILQKTKIKKTQYSLTLKITKLFANLAMQQQKIILAIFTTITIIGIYGIFNLSIENRFIDYYKKDTEIHQGMKAIDQNLGGTIPLDIIIEAPKNFQKTSNSFNIFGQIDNSNNITSGYWFNPINHSKIAQIHKYLEETPEIGKVNSLYSTLELIKQIDKNLTNNSFNLGLIYKKLNQDIKKQIFTPYISSDGNQIRINTRIYETNQNLKRNELINKIKYDLSNQLKLEKDQFTLTGMTILYNNILQSLFKSQILTLGFVFLIIFLMFLILFKNFYLSLIAIIPNIFSAIFILGIMGISKISLDIMTITIAAISIGIAVDNTIHYIHRFKTEFQNSNNIKKALTKTSNSIGRAIFYTAIIISSGFFTLTLSNFMPTIYFGILTATAMLASLLANLILLPAIIIILKPKI